MQFLPPLGSEVHFFRSKSLSLAHTRPGWGKWATLRPCRLSGWLIHTRLGTGICVAVVFQQRLPSIVSKGGDERGVLLGQ